MKMMPKKFFNTAGPINTDMHYSVDSLQRIDIEEIEQLIHNGKYFVIHVPRQTGKTSALLALRDYLNASGDCVAVYANIEAGQAMRNQVAEVVKATAVTIAESSSTVMKSDFPMEVLESVLGKRGATDSNLLASYLRAFCEALDRPLVLFLDEIDALVGDSLVSILRQIRSEYDQRPSHFPQTVVLCGVRDARDYLYTVRPYQRETVGREDLAPYGSVQWADYCTLGDVV